MTDVLAASTMTDVLATPDALGRALLCALVLGALLPLLGVLVVQRGLAFVGDGLAHAAFGGVAVAILAGAAPDQSAWFALPFTVAVGVAMAAVMRRAGLRGDAAIAIFFSFSLAVGLICLHLAGGARSANLEELLFGDLLGLTNEALAVTLSLSAIALLLVAVGWSRLAFVAFDRELARLAGLDVRLLDKLLLALAAAVVVIAVRAMGALLVSAIVVIPAATARLLARSLARATLIAMALGALGSTLGVLVAHAAGLPPSATIVVTLGLVFFATVAARRGPAASES